ncbi:MAG: Rieske 2Fe-2S domain-containing protein [Candidatus Acidiferrales bacterium]
MATANTVDLTKGFPANGLPDGGMIQGKVGDEDVILARRKDEFFAVGSNCTHYHAALLEGLIVGGKEERRLRVRSDAGLEWPVFRASGRWDPPPFRPDPSWSDRAPIHAAPERPLGRRAQGHSRDQS